MEVRPSGTVTFLFTDVEGSTRLWEQHRQAMQPALATHDRLIGSAIEAHGGYVFSTAGDAFSVAFARAGDAVTAAVDAQLSLAAEEWGSTEIRVRMGIHTGEAEERDGDYFGPPLNRGARLMAAAHGGQVLASAVTVRLISDRLPEGISFVDLGEHRLKDLDAPEQIFQVIETTLRREFPPPRTIDARRSNLPDPLTSFIGRRRNVEEVTALVQDNRLVSLTGVGGVGKTRLALRVAGGLVGHFPDGVWFVDLGGITDPSLIPKQTATALSVQEQADRPIESTLVDWLRGRETLILIDNCEHLIDQVAGFTERMLDEAREVTVLATTREALGIPGETVWIVPPLPVPGNDPEQLMDNDAVRLLVDRAQRVDREFSVTADNVVALAEICRGLDGVPLALELAAARMGVLSPRQIADRLSDRLALLGRGSRTGQARQQTLRAAIDWSYDLLDPNEQAMLRMLAVFRGGFNLEAVEALWSAKDNDTGPALDLLDQLVGKSLVTLVGRDTDRRFGLLETIRDYAQDQLENSGELETMLERHRAFFLDWTKQQARLLSTPDQLVALTALEADHDNLRAVIERSVTTGDLEHALLVVADLSFFWWLHSHFGESGVWYDRLLSARQRVPAKVRAKLLLGAGEFSMGVCQYSQAATRFEEACRLAEETGSARIQGWALAYSMTNETYRMDLNAARSYGEEAIKVFERSNDALGIGYITYMQETLRFAVLWRTGSMTREDAESILGRLNPILMAARAVGDRNLLGHVHELLGSVALIADRPEMANRHLADAVRYLDEIGNQSCLAHALDRVALMADHHGRAADAVRLLAAARALRDRIGVAARIAEQLVHDRVLESARSGLNTAEYSATWSQGTGLDGHAAVRSALMITGEGDTDPPVDRG
jgi:predicted ATPase/class 3 adenylate cyclase